LKRIYSIFLLLTLFACDSSLQILSTKKQTIIPGIQTVKPYTKYLVEVQVNSDKTLKVDSVLVFEKEKSCRKATHFIKDAISHNVVSEVTGSGRYVIDATVKESSAEAEGCQGAVNKIIVFYKLNKRTATIEIATFKEETVRKR
jgi:hypothetical protein